MKSEFATPEPATKWVIYTLEDIIELAEDDDVIITTEPEALNYLKNRKDNYIKVIGHGIYHILFA